MWLGSELCDYNGPLLAPRFSERVDRGALLGLWEQITLFLRAGTAPMRSIDLQKMPEASVPSAIRSSVCPSRQSERGVSDASRGRLGQIYAAKRSSATRRRDRTKRKRLGDLGAVTPQSTPQSEVEIISRRSIS